MGSLQQALMAAMQAADAPPPASNIVNPLTSRTVYSQDYSVGVSMFNNGTIQVGDYLDNWYTPTTANAGQDYWARCTVVGDPLDWGWSGAWFQIYTNPYWSYESAKSGVWTIHIASDQYGNNIVSTGTYTVSMSGVKVPLTDRTIAKSHPSINALAIANNGTISWTDSIPGDNWYLPTSTGVGSSYWVRLTVSGDAPDIATAGAVDTWLKISEGPDSTQGPNRWWAYDSASDRSGVWTIEIATDAAGTNIVTSGAFTLTLT